MDVRHRPRFAQTQTYARAAPIRRENQMVLSLVAFALASAIMAIWATYLSTASNSILSNLAPFPATGIAEGVQKADRLSGPKFEDRWNPVLTIHKTSSIADRIKKLPIGCETAFSPLLKAQKFLARCLASKDEIGRGNG